MDYALEACGREGRPLVLDELPYRQHSVPGIESLLQHAWDGHDGAVKLVLTGSSFSVLDAAVADPRAPLYGRRTAQLEVQPMSFAEVADFYPGWSFEQRAVAWGLFGGVPAYAEQAARHASPAEAALALALSPTGPLHTEPECLVREELRDPGVYFSILHSLAAGLMRPNRIAQDAGVPGPSTDKYLDVLRRLRLVHRDVPVTEARPERSRKGLYRLSDPFLRFWFRYVYPNRSALEAGAGREVLETVVLPDLDTFMGPLVRGDLPAAPDRGGAAGARLAAGAGRPLLGRPDGDRPDCGRRGPRTRGVRRVQVGAQRRRGADRPPASREGPRRRLPCGGLAPLPRHQPDRHRRRASRSPGMSARPPRRVGHGTHRAATVSDCSGGTRRMPARAATRTEAAQAPGILPSIARSSARGRRCWAALHRAGCRKSAGPRRA